MPTYEYVCDACKHAFEQFQSITAKPLRTCPECGKRALQRLIGSGGGIIFKGSGFYQTDYRSDAYRKAAEAEKPKTTEKAAADAKDAAPKSTSTKTDAEASGKKKPAKAETKTAAKTGE
jgi:putative FmdB family regulatory protein